MAHTLCSSDLSFDLYCFQPLLFLLESCTLFCPHHDNVMSISFHKNSASETFKHPLVKIKVFSCSFLIHSSAVISFSCCTPPPPPPPPPPSIYLSNVSISSWWVFSLACFYTYLSFFSFQSLWDMFLCFSNESNALSLFAFVAGFLNAQHSRQDSQ